MLRALLNGLGGRSQRGAITPMVVVLIPTFMLLVGLVNDVGRHSVTSERAQSIAGQCARAGGQITSAERLGIDPRQVEARVGHCPLLPSGWTARGSWNATTGVIEVTVTAPVDGTMLGALSGSTTVSETAYAAILVK